MYVCMCVCMWSCGHVTRRWWGGGGGGGGCFVPACEAQLCASMQVTNAVIVYYQ